MFNNYKTKKDIFNVLNRIEIPRAERVLPAESFVRDDSASQLTPFPRLALRRVMVVASLVCLIIASTFVAFNYYGKGTIDPPPITLSEDPQSSLPSDETPDDVSDDQTEQLVTSDGQIELLYDVDNIVYDKSNIYISRLLQEKLDEYKGQDVVFRVAVDLPISFESEQLDFARQSGATNILSYSQTTDFKPLYQEGYIMELSSQTLEKMIEHKGYVLRLAPPERVAGYNKSIADHLTNYLEKLSSTDTLEVQVITKANELSGIAGEDNKPLKSYEGIYFESPYRASPVSLPWDGGVLSFDELEKYVEKIVTNNSLTHSFVKKERSEYDDFYQLAIYEGNAVYDSPKQEKIEDMNYMGSFFDIVCTFSINLTKDEILRLAEDADVVLLRSTDFAYFANNLPTDQHLPNYDTVVTELSPGTVPDKTSSNKREEETETPDIVWDKGVEIDSGLVDWHGKRIGSSLYEGFLRYSDDTVFAIAVQATGGKNQEYLQYIYNDKTLAEYKREAEEESKLPEKLLQLLKIGDDLKYGQALYKTGNDKGQKWSKDHYDSVVAFFGEELLSRYIVDGEFLRKKLEYDCNQPMEVTAGVEWYKAYEAYEDHIIRQTKEQLTEQGVVFKSKIAAFDTNIQEHPDSNNQDAYISIKRQKPYLILTMTKQEFLSLAGNYDFNIFYLADQDALNGVFPFGPTDW